MSKETKQNESNNIVDKIKSYSLLKISIVILLVALFFGQDVIANYIVSFYSHTFGEKSFITVITGYEVVDGISLFTDGTHVNFPWHQEIEQHLYLFISFSIIIIPFLIISGLSEWHKKNNYSFIIAKIKFGIGLILLIALSYKMTTIITYKHYLREDMKRTVRLDRARDQHYSVLSQMSFELKQLFVKNKKERILTGVNPDIKLHDLTTSKLTKDVKSKYSLEMVFTGDTLCVIHAIGEKTGNDSTFVNFDGRIGHQEFIAEVFDKKDLYIGQKN